MSPIKRTPSNINPKYYSKEMPFLRQHCSPTHLPVEGNLTVANAAHGQPDAYAAKRELGPYTAKEILKNDLSPRMAEEVVQTGMRVSPSKRGEKAFEPPNFKLAKTRVALAELRATA